MGLNLSFLVYSSDGALDLTEPVAAGAADAVIGRLFPRTPYRRVATRPLLDTSFPERGTPAVGVYDDGVLIATRDAHLYDPDILHTRYHKLTEWPDLRLLTSRSANGMFAYARWRDGRMQRCISVNAVAGVWRNDGAAEAFEGSEAVSDDRWLDLCNGALASVLSLEGDAARPVSNAVDWEDVGLHVFAR